MREAQPTTSQSPSPRTRRLTLAALFALAAAAGSYKLNQVYRPALVHGPLLQIGESGQLRVVWQAAGPSGPVRTGEVRWPDRGNPTRTRVASADATTMNFLAAAIDGATLPDSFWYELRARGLLGQSLVLSREDGVRRPAEAGRTFRFLAFGDSGNGSNTQRALVEQMLLSRPDLVIHTGDLVYPKGEAADYPANFFIPNRELIARAPFMPSLGNHDVATEQGRPYLDTFVLPENGPPGLPPERNYWFDVGDARFVALDTNRDTQRGAISESQMREVVAPWLRRVLTAAGGRWKFVYFHHPPYTNATHRPEDQQFVKDIFVPVFDACRVDVVFCGHNHLYERTKPIRDDRVVPPGDGTVYIVTGAGGVSRYPEALPPLVYIAAYNDSAFSFTRVDVGPEKLSLTQLDDRGRVIDTLTLGRRSVD
ncbi:MAG: metallophosphoesterase [Phycisphaerae bacterium]|nr:metallophosphoesterase [Phycisphaerae bacterium]